MQTTMYRIVICDDEMGIRHTLQRFLERYAQENSEEFEILAFSSANDLLKSYPSDIDLLFLDIKMQGINGMDAAREIRKSDSQVCIIFITTMYQYAIEGYSVRAFGFIRKPVNYSEFSHELGCALIHIRGNREKETIINVKSGSAIHRLAISQIKYVEVRNHNVLFSMDGQTIEARGQMNQLEEQFKPYGFFRPHASYLVNFDFISRIDNNVVILKDGTNIPMSQHRKKEFVSNISSFIGARI